MRYSLVLTTAVTAAAAAVAVGLGANSALGAPTSSHSSPDDVQLPQNATLQQIQAAAVTAVSNRVNALNTAIGKVQGATNLGTDQAELLSTLQADIPALQQLGERIAADSTTQAALGDYADIATMYRVYDLVLPVTRLVVASDQVTNVRGPRLTSVAAKIAAKQTSSNQAHVAPLLADLSAKVGAATTAVRGLPATLEGYTPAQSVANGSLLSSAQSALKTALGDLKSARSDAKQAASELGLKAKAADPTSSTTS
jgi:hypothetical protein